MRGIILLTAALTLPLLWPADCRLDHASVEVVEPAVVTVLATLRCGGIVCFVRYVEQEGKRIRETRACEATEQNRDTLMVPVPAPRPGGNLP